MMGTLVMDLQPVFMAGHSLQDRDRSRWEGKVRPSVVPKLHPKCAICGFVALEKRRLIEADEVWAFPGPPNVVLVDIRPLCTRCHAAKDYAQLLRLIQSGSAAREREDQIKQHYCAVNNCSEDQFAADFEAALAAKRELEERYNPNCHPNVDYGRWGRPSDKPCISDAERAFLKELLEFRDEPIFVGEHKFSSPRSAAKTLQAIPLDQRSAIFAALRDYFEEDDEPITEADEGVQFK